ncbi:MAG: GNAT family N-acetyltransferase [Candidatus Acidiferrales bacterium]
MSTAARQFAGEIRPASAADYARMAELAGQLGYPSDAGDIARRLAGMNARGEHAVFVAQLADGAIAGWIGAFVYRSVEADARVEISGLVVDERHRSQAVGRHLLERAEEWAREKGYSGTSLRSNVIRERAHAFYEREGYEHTKTQKSFRKKL